MIDEKKLLEDLIPILQNIDNYYLVGRIIGCIDSQPKLSLENKTNDKWIPYDDEHEKPNEVGWYRVTELSFLITRIINFRFWNGYRFEGCEEIIAWQPNPEPYKGEE